jgi:predicted dehydrogenase
MNRAAKNKQMLHQRYLGAGRIAKTFARDIQHVEHTKLYGEGIRHLANAETFAAIDATYGNYVALLADSEVDAIHTATLHSYQKSRL